MKIKSLQIKNFKSIEDLVLIEPNPFSVFVGPNGAGKSNIFEALEFVSFLYVFTPEVSLNFFGEPQDYLKKESFSFKLGTENSEPLEVQLTPTWDHGILKSIQFKNDYGSTNTDQTIKLALSPYLEFVKKFQKVFLANRKKGRPNINMRNEAVSVDGSNLERVLKRVFQDTTLKEEITEWLKILIPEFKDIEIRSSDLSGEISFVIFEKSTNTPFAKHLISDGTQNILTLLTAVYQSNEPQFLCIEEPENGLHPLVIKELVNLFRTACEEKGHYIWLNTHSETLVRQLRPEELILVDKRNGATQVKQLKGFDTFGLELDEAWLTNALNGGVI